MNKVETLRKFVEFEEKTYVPSLYITACGRWAIKYQEILTYDSTNLLCSAVVEEDNESTEINDTYDRIGNARSLDEAVDMIERYLNNVLRIK